MQVTTNASDNQFESQLQPIQVTTNASDNPIKSVYTYWNGYNLLALVSFFSYKTLSSHIPHFVPTKFYFPYHRQITLFIL